MQPTMIQLFEEDGTRVVVPEPIRAIRRAFLVATLIGSPGSFKHNWAKLIALLAWREFQRDGEPWSRDIVARWDLIHRDPEAAGAC